MANGEINATDLTEETTSTLSGNEQFVMFDPVEGKRADIDEVAKYIAGDKSQLQTSEKSSVVGAINEVNGKAADLKEDLRIYDDGLKKFPGTYEYSELNANGEIVARPDHKRASIPDYYTAVNNDVLIIGSGFSCVLCRYNNSESLINRSVIPSGTYRLVQGSKYRISILYADSRVINSLNEVLFSALILTNTEKKIYSLQNYEFAPLLISGKYVAVVNSGEESSVGFAEVTDYIQVNGVTEVFTSLSSVLSLCYYDFDKVYISGVTGTDGESGNWHILTIPANAYFIRVSNDTRYNTEGVKIRKANQTLINNALTPYDKKELENKIIDKYTTDIIPMYNRIICIGDSLTWSQVYTSNTTQRQAYKTYPDILGTLTGCEADLYATPGDDAILWWQRSSAGAFDNHGLYIVSLGTNNGLTDTIDTDCTGTDPDDPNDFANTNTGQYGRILQSITNNGDKAVLVIPWKGGGISLATTQIVVQKFSIKYGFPCISINVAESDNDYYHYYPDKTGKNTLHFNDLGYAWLANEVRKRINLLAAEDQWNLSRTQ